MAYQAIYRKWCPTTFEDVVGQSHITDTLKTELKTNRLAHAYLFCGTRGTGKTTTAKILSRAVNCEHLTENGNPCNECESCKGILNNTIMDVVEIDAASNNGVDNIRELRDEISYTPANVKYKIYIIDEVHMLSAGAFNALLKTLEEPPAHAIFILATTEPHKIPATIQSRCQRFDFKRISVKNIAGRIGEIVRKDKMDITQEAINLVAELGDGSMRDALSILDLCSGIEGKINVSDIEKVTGAVSRITLRQLAEDLINTDAAASIIAIDKLLENGREINILLDELIMTLREIMICKIVPDPLEVTDKSEEEINEYKKIAEKTSAEEVIYIIKILSETAGLCKTSVNPRVIFESAVIKICNPSYDTSTEAFAARLKRLESAIAGNEVKNISLPAADKNENIAKISDGKTESSDAKQHKINGENLIEDDKNSDETEEDKKAEQESVFEDNSSDSYEKINVSAFAEKFREVNIGLASLMEKSEIEVHNGVYYIIFEEKIFKRTIIENEEFVGSIKRILNCENIKVLAREEVDADKKDPLDEIISMSGDIEQFSMF